MNFGVCLTVYNDKEALKRCLDSIHDYVDRIIIVDGRFEHFTKIKDSNHSTDGTLKLIKKYSKVELYYYSDHILKMLSYMFSRCKGLDVAMILGADTYVEGDWNKFYENLEKWYYSRTSNMGSMKYKIISGDPRELTTKNRLFVDPANVSMGKRHWHYMYNGKRLVANNIGNDIPDVDGLIVYHDDGIRSKSRNKLMDEYQGLPKHVRG